MAFQNYPEICPVCKRKSKFAFVMDFSGSQNKHSLYQCSACRVQFWQPMKNPGSVWYEGNNPYKVRDIVEQKISRGYHKKFLENYKTFPEGTKVLDLGCGAGEFIAELEKRGCEAWGVDFDRDAIKIAKQRFGLKNVFAMPLDEFFKKAGLPKFDFITFFEFIEHSDNLPEFIENVKRLLKPSGKIVLSTPCRERMLVNLNSWDFPPHHFTRWNEESVKNIFEEENFKILRVDYVEQSKIISESVSGIFATGMVGKSLQVTENKKSFLIVPKIVYFLGRLKNLFLGVFPAIFLWILGKITGRKNGIMLIELTEKNNKKIVFFAPTLGAGGGERLVSELSLNFSENIQRIIVIFESIKNKNSYPYRGKIISLDLPISANIIVKIWAFTMGFLKFKNIIKKEKPDHVISFGGQMNILNILSGRTSLVRVENFIPMSNNFREKIYGILIKVLFNKADKVVVVSRQIANSLENNFGVKKEKIKLIYNPIDVKKIQGLAGEPIEAEYREIFENPVIINAGRLAEMKGQWHLIKAFSRVKKEVKNAKLVILGKGELEHELKKMVKDFNLEKDVYFLGWQKNPFKFLANSKLFVLSSLGWEGLPYIILEAMACGLPIVSVDCKSGPREIIAPDTDQNHQASNIEYAPYGILTPVCRDKFSGAENPLTLEEKLLGDAITGVLADKALFEQLKDKSKRRADDFDVSKILKEWDFLNT